MDREDWGNMIVLKPIIAAAMVGEKVIYRERQRWKDERERDRDRDRDS